MELSTYSKNIQKQVDEIIAQLSETAKEKLIPTLRKLPKGGLEQEIFVNHAFLLDYIVKTPKARAKIEKSQEEYMIRMRLIALFELQKTALFLEHLDHYLLIKPTAYRAFAAHTSQLLQDISYDKVVDRLEKVIQGFS